MLRLPVGEPDEICKINVLAMNIHATAIALGAFGVLIEGPSGSGKTSLALAAIEHMSNKGLFAALVADDQCLIETANNRVIASCPLPLTGLVEMRGLGIVKHPNITSSVIMDIVIRMVEHNQIERMPEPETTTIAGLHLPVFKLPARQIAMSLPLLCQLVENRRF
jgi:serine kinase of HPr protein (carbohydrate metabolism regulator)